MFIDPAHRAEIEMLIPADSHVSKGQCVAWLVALMYLAMIAALAIGIVRSDIEHMNMPKSRLK